MNAGEGGVEGGERGEGGRWEGGGDAIPMLDWELA